MEHRSAMESNSIQCIHIKQLVERSLTFFLNLRKVSFKYVLKPCSL